MFDFSKVDNFDKHINLSIPSYETLSDVFAGIACAFAHSESTVVDIGCSTGRFLSALPKCDGCDYLGIDRVKFKDMNKDFSFSLGDAKEILPTVKNVSVIVSMFCLQFMGEKKRSEVLEIVKEKIDQGATFLISEKIFLNDPVLQTLIHRMHIQEKRKSFTDKEILDKDIQLSTSMFCKTEKELVQELTQIGSVVKVWQSYNFVGYVVK
jgi:SAM-dependent methyltransferase|tara:strand:- start:78 stop:704 length:627 start_codon:yes stop_codon:yes gene_type:complete